MLSENMKERESGSAPKGPKHRDHTHIYFEVVIISKSANIQSAAKSVHHIR